MNQAIAVRILSSIEKSMSLFCLPLAMYSSQRPLTSPLKVCLGTHPNSAFALSDEAKKCAVLKPLIYKYMEAMLTEMEILLLFLIQ